MPTRRIANLLLVNVLIGTTVAWSGPSLAEEQLVNVYTYREPGLIQPLLDRFTKETGVQTQVIFAKEGLEQRIQAEGENSPADVLLATDIARLQEAVATGITQPISSQVLSDRIPANLRDPANNWFGLSMRARVVYAAKDRVDASGLTYEDLADPRWKGKICIRSGQHNYNNALFAAFIAHHGEAQAEVWLTGLKANLAQKPAGGDRDVAKDIASGTCEIGIGNTYYVGLMMADPEKKAWADAIKVVMPVFKDGGTHVNVSGAAVAKHAPHKDNAIKLVEWLSGTEAQRIYASSNYEYPVVKGVAVDPVVAAWGDLEADAISLSDIAAAKKAAAAIVDKIAFDEGAN